MTNLKTPSQFVTFESKRKHRMRCPICGRAAPDNFCIVHGDVKALDLTKSKKAQKLTKDFLSSAEKHKKQKRTVTKAKKPPRSLQKEALAYLKKRGYTGLISAEFLARKEKAGVTLKELKKSHLDLLIQADKEEKAKERERKRKDIIGKQDRARTKKKTTAKAKTATATKSQVKERQSQRTPRAQAMDSKKRAKRVVGPDKYGLWLKHPNRYDIEGIDI